MTLSPNLAKGVKFTKGVSGNPKGRPKRIPDLDLLLADVLGEEKDGIEAAKAILMALRSKAVKGDVRAAEVLLDRAYGKAMQKTENTTHVSIEPNPDAFFDKLLGDK